MPRLSHLSRFVNKYFSFYMNYDIKRDVQVLTFVYYTHITYVYNTLKY